MCRRPSTNSIDPIIAFSRKVFGIHSYQSSSWYLNWALSNDNIEIVTTDNASKVITSMIHKMKIVLNKTEFISVFNYVSDPDHLGDGLRHLANLRREDKFFVPAVSNTNLCKVYEKMGANEVKFNWFQRYLIPLPHILLVFKFITGQKIEFTNRKSGISYSNSISDEKIRLIADASGIDDPNFISWRLCSRRNNRTFIFELEREKALIIAMMGKRRKLPVVRIVGGYGSSSDIKRLVDSASSFGRGLGAVVCLATVHGTQSHCILNDRRYRVRHGIKTYMKGLSPPEHLLMLCGDLGFDEQFGS